MSPITAGWGISDPRCHANYIDFTHVSPTGAATIGGAFAAGFQVGDQLVRVSTPLADTRVGFDLEQYARVYNSTSNANDFMYTHACTGPILGNYTCEAWRSQQTDSNGFVFFNPPFSVFTSTAVNKFSTSTLTADLQTYASTTIITGRIMPQAYVTASDPYSGSTETYSITVSSYGMNLLVPFFQLVGVTTTSYSCSGASTSSFTCTGNPWIVEIVSSTTYNGQVYWKELSPIPSGRNPDMYGISDTLLGQNNVYGIPHSSNTATLVAPLSPIMPHYTKIYYGINLDSAPPGGFVTGFVTDPYNNPLSSIQMNAGGITTATNAQGRYFGMSSTGTVIIIANSTKLPPYIEQTALVTINSGQILEQDFALFQGGGVTGYVTSGTTPLPNIQVIALIGGNQYGSGSSDTSGQFYINNLSSGTYTIEPSLDPAAASSPQSTTVTISSYTVNVGTFTITGALANISGSITYNGATLNTGALIVASVGAIGSTPPSISASSSPALSNPVYAISSQADGTFTLPVRIANGYNISA